MRLIALLLLLLLPLTGCAEYLSLREPDVIRRTTEGTGKDKSYSVDCKWSWT